MKQSMSTSVASAGALMIMGRTIARASTLIVALVLARLVPPEGFGLVAIALLTNGLVEVFTQVGAKEYLIQRQRSYEGLAATAFGLELTRGITIAVLIVALAPSLASLFNDARATPVIMTMALVPLLNAGTNINIYAYMRELDFKRHFALEATGPLVGLAVAIALAIYLRSAWALVAGTVSGAVTKCALSYLIASAPRPALRWKRVRLFINFSIHVFWGAIATYFALHSGTLFTALLLNSTALGYFSLAWTLANFSSNELAKPFTRVVFAALSRVQNDSYRLNSALERSYTIVFAGTAPICVIMAILAEDIEEGILGRSWNGISPLLTVLALASLIRLLSTSGGGLFWGLGRPDIPGKLALVTGAGMTAFAAGYCFLVPRADWDSTGFAFGWGFGYFLYWIGWLLYAQRLADFGLQQWCRSQWPVIVGLTVTGLATSFFQSIMEPGLSRLLIAGSAAGVVYVATETAIALIMKAGPVATGAQVFRDWIPMLGRLSLAKKA